MVVSGSSLALASPGGPGGGVCAWQELTDSATLIMPDRSLLPQGWPCAALIWLGKGEGLGVRGGSNTKLDVEGTELTWHRP